MHHNNKRLKPTNKDEQHGPELHPAASGGWWVEGRGGKSPCFIRHHPCCSQCSLVKNSHERGEGPSGKCNAVELYFLLFMTNTSI